MPPVPRKRIPTVRAATSSPPTVVAPTSPAIAQAARSRGPTLRASEVKRASSSSVSPTRTRPSSTPVVAGTAPALTHGAVALEPDLDAVRCGEAVRDERRLERDDRRAVLERGAHLVGELNSSFMRRKLPASRRAAGRSAPQLRAPGRARRRSSPPRGRLRRQSSRPPARRGAPRVRPRRRSSLERRA